jgi:hypothetical protein
LSKDASFLETAKNAKKERFCTFSKYGSTMRGIRNRMAVARYRIGVGKGWDITPRNT